MSLAGYDTGTVCYARIHGRVRRCNVGAVARTTVTLVWSTESGAARLTKRRAVFTVEEWAHDSYRSTVAAFLLSPSVAELFSVAAQLRSTGEALLESLRERGLA